MDTLRVALDYRPAVLGSTGIGRAVRGLARALAGVAGIELHLFAHSFAHARRDDPIPPGAHLHRLPIPGRSLPWLAKLRLGAERLAGGVPLFHWTDYIHPPLVTARAILTLHDLAFAEDASFHGEASAVLLARSRAAAHRARLVLTPSAATARAAERHLELPRARLRVVPFGADHVPSVHGPHPLAGRPYILTVGTIEPRKNHVRLLAALALLAEPRPLLVVVGQPGWECAAAVRALREAEARGAVLWLQRVGDRRMFDFLAHAELLVYPSLLEGFGFPPLEAMAMGTPVVVHEGDALVEVLDDAARRCAATEPAAIASAIDEVLRDTALRRTLIERGRRRARAFTWSACAAGHVAAYREAMA